MVAYLGFCGHLIYSFYSIDAQTLQLSSALGLRQAHQLTLSYEGSYALFPHDKIRARSTEAGTLSQSIRLVPSIGTLFLFQLYTADDRGFSSPQALNSSLIVVM